MSLLLLFNQGSTPTITATLTSFTATTATFSLVGEGTAWTGGITFSLIGAGAASITSHTVTNGTHASITVTFGSPPNHGPYTGTDGTSGFSLPFVATGGGSLGNQVSVGIGLGISL